MKYKKILFLLLFIFLASGFLFFNVGIARGAEGMCTCDIINTDTGDIEEAQDVTDESEDACSQLETTTQSDGFMYQKCLWVSSQPTSGEAAASPPIDLPSVAGLKQLENDNVKSIFGNIIYVAMGLLGSIALALFAYAGVLWMLSGGNSEQATKARNIVVWAVLGLFVIFASYTIVSFIFSAVE